MPVRYSEDSEGPSTRRAIEVPPDGTWSEEIEGDGTGKALPPIYSTLSKPELQDLLSERGLPTSGNKPDLIERLEENDAA